jgi:pyruvate kinase
MRTICQEAESVLLNDGEIHIGYEPAPDGNRTNTESVAMAVAHIAEEKRVAAIASLSYSGETARLISNRRPRAPIFSITTEIAVARRMGLLWGVTGMLFKKTSSTDQAIEQIKALLVREKRLVVGSTVVFTIGRPLVGRAKTNMLSIETL